MIHACHNKRGRKSHHNVGICFRLRHVSTQTPMYQHIGNRPFGVLQKSSFMLLLLMIWTPVNNKVTFSLFIRFWRILFLNNFTYLCLYAFQKTFRVMTASNPHRHTKKRLIKTVGAHTPCTCGYMQDGELYFYTFGMPKEPSLWYVKQK